MQRHHRNQFKTYQSISLCGIKQSGNKEGDYSKCFRNQEKVGRVGGGAVEDEEEEEDKWMGGRKTNCLERSRKKGFVILFFFLVLGLKLCLSEVR